MKRFLLALALLLPLPAQAQQTKAALTTEINTNFATGVPGGITAATLRTTSLDIINSIMPTAPVVAGNLACYNGTTGLLQDCGSSPTSFAGALTITSASANALAVGRLGATTPAFNVDASTGTQVAGLNVKGAVTGGTVAVSAIDSGSNTNLIIDAKGTGTIGIGTVSSGAVTITPALTLGTPLVGGSGGTGNGFMNFTGPAASLKTFTLPNATDTIATLGAIQTITAAKTFNNLTLILAGSSSGTTNLIATAAASGTITLPAATDTLMGKATTDIMTNKTFNSTAAGNSLQVGGVNLFTGQYPGEPTTGSATAGNVGELISSTVTSGSAVALTTATVANITSISLTAGDWDVSAMGYFGGGATTTWTWCETSMSTTSVTHDRTDTRNYEMFYNGAVLLGTINQLTSPTGPSRFSVSGATTVFLVARCNFGTSTANAFGTIRARRMR